VKYIIQVGVHPSFRRFSEISCELWTKELNDRIQELEERVRQKEEDIEAERRKGAVHIEFLDDEEDNNDILSF
jgi:hypothetical protein